MNTDAERVSALLGVLDLKRPRFRAPARIATLTPKFFARQELVPAPPTIK